jgi:hypothetical protein
MTCQEISLAPWNSAIRMAGRDRGGIFKKGIALELWKREISSAESGDSGKGRAQRRRSPGT